MTLLFFWHLTSGEELGKNLEDGEDSASIIDTNMTVGRASNQIELVDSLTGVW